MTAASTIDEYIAATPPEVRPVMESIRAAIERAVPGVEETISYGMPTFAVAGRSVVHVAAWKRHIGLYPVPVVDDALELRLSAYRSTKDTLRLPLSKPMPLELVAEVVQLLVRQRAADRS